jgi:hypothetical protein
MTNTLQGESHLCIPIQDTQINLLSIKCYKQEKIDVATKKSFYMTNTLQGESHLCIPFLGIARPQSQFPHSCVGERFIYSQDWSTYFPVAE